MSDADSADLDTSKINDWRSIVTLVVFVLTNLAVLFPFHVPVYLPRILPIAVRDTLSALRIIAPRVQPVPELRQGQNAFQRHVQKFRFPVNFVTAPLIADLFLLAILAIGRQEVYDGTVGSENISPLDIMAFFFTLAYIAISIDASGLIRYLAFKVVQKGGKYGHKLFLYLYTFFFGLGSFIGNDPIILSGTAFLAYMTRVSSNIVHPRAWIHSQFAIANIASAILVSSNPTNLVLAGAFEIKFIVYTANMIVPVVATAVVLFPFLLYIVFAKMELIPHEIHIHELSEESKSKAPVNPNIPNARGTGDENDGTGETGGQQISLEEVMNPFLDKSGAAVGAIVMAATLIAILVLNAAAHSSQAIPVFYVTLPAAVLQLGWDLASGWKDRHKTRAIARKGREEIERARIEHQERREREARELEAEQQNSARMLSPDVHTHSRSNSRDSSHQTLSYSGGVLADDTGSKLTPADTSESVRRESNEDNLPLPQIAESTPAGQLNEKTLAQDTTNAPIVTRLDQRDLLTPTVTGGSPEASSCSPSKVDADEKAETGIVSVSPALATSPPAKRATLVTESAKAYRWSQETFPTVMAVLSHLPFALVPFALCMFVLVQALVTKGWVQVFAYGWDHWVNKTGTVGSIGGMGFLSVILCNFAGTNIGTTILLCRVIQAWIKIHNVSGDPISDRTFWATVYSMALGVNYGAFSAAFSASLAGLLWRDILMRKFIRVRRLEFARVNLPIIAIAMAVGCAVLTGEIYIVRGDQAFSL